MEKNKFAVIGFLFSILGLTALLATACGSNNSPASANPSNTSTPTTIPTSTPQYPGSISGTLTFASGVMNGYTPIQIMAYQSSSPYFQVGSTYVSTSGQAYTISDLPAGT